MHFKKLSAKCLSFCWDLNVSAYVTKGDRLKESRGCFITLRLRQNGRHFPDDVFKCIFWTENVWISLKISLKFVPKFRINNIPALVQIMACRRPGEKPLFEPMMVNLLTHICVTRPQWVNTLAPGRCNSNFCLYYFTLLYWTITQAARYCCTDSTKRLIIAFTYSTKRLIIALTASVSRLTD